MSAPCPRRGFRPAGRGGLLCLAAALALALPGCSEPDPDTPVSSILGLLARLDARPNRKDHRRLTRAVARAPEAETIHLLGDEVLAVGLTDDLWTAGGKPAAVLVRNPGEEPLRPELYLDCHAAPTALPIAVRVHDGERPLERTFRRAGRVALDLAPVPPGGERLYIINTDATWVPGPHDPRPLGVRVSLPLGPWLERLYALPEGPERRRLLAMLSERPFLGKERLLGDLVVAMGLERGRWSSDLMPVGIVVHNPRADAPPLRVGLVLVSEAPERGRPLTARLSSGPWQEEVRFARPGERRVLLAPVSPGKRRLFLLTTDRTFAPGVGQPPRGVQLALDPRQALRNLLRHRGALRRSHLAHLAETGPLPERRTLAPGVTALALSPDGWTTDGDPAALVLVNRSPRARRYQLELNCDAPPAKLPITAVLQFGASWRPLRFARAEARRVLLPAVPPFQRRLVLLYTDRTWSPGAAHDSRSLGVRVAGVRALAAGDRGPSAALEGRR